MEETASQAIIDSSRGDTPPIEIAPALLGRKVFTATELSCPTAVSVATRYRDFLIRHGAEKAERVDEADVILVDTCAYSSLLEARSLKYIEHQQSKARPDVKVIVTGCLAAINPESIKSVFKGEMFSPKSEEQLGVIFGIEKSAESFFKSTELRSGFNGKYQPSTDWAGPPSTWVTTCRVLHAVNNRFGINWVQTVRRILDRNQSLNPQAYNLAVSQGCVGSCSFCAIPFAKGRTRSVQLGRIIDKIKEMASVGVKDFVLTSEDVGAYGIDIGISIVTLLEHINDLSEDIRVHVWFFDPRWLKKYESGLMQVLEAGRIKSLQLPLQSGSDPILKAMRRGYQLEHVLPIIRKIRTRFPDVCLTTQFITGFPGETDDDFARTMALIEAEYFDYGQGFAFEERPGIAAAAMPGKISQEIRVARAETIKAYYRQKSLRLLLRSIPIAETRPA